MLRIYLRLRTWLGWGRHPDGLRVRARLYVSMASRLLPHTTAHELTDA
jgi:hypothetical protein